MPRIPEIKDLDANSVDILNTIRNNASPQYQNLIPVADSTTDSIRTIGNIMMQYQPLQNEFLTNLVNRIGRVILTSKLYTNPWAFFKKGLLEFGETVEEIFVNIAKPFQFDPERAEKTVWRREIPDVRAAFHTMNYQKFYKATVSNDQLRTAFLSWSGITDLIAKIVDAMYTGANYDEFQTMKYLLAYTILNGGIGSTTIPTTSETNMKSIIATVKAFSNGMEFMDNTRNMAGVMNYTLKDDQFVIINATFQAQMDVEVLASAFNMGKTEFMGHMVMIDGFGKFNTQRLDELLKDNPGYHQFTTSELTALNQIPLVIVSRDFFMIFDNFYNFTELYNGEGLYWNYWYHCWKTFSISPFAEAQIFTPTASSVTSITVTPATVTVHPGDIVRFSANVKGTGFFSQAVEFSAGDGIPGTLQPDGSLKIFNDYPEWCKVGDSYDVTCTSLANPEITSTATITLA